MNNPDKLAQAADPKLLSAPDPAHFLPEWTHSPDQAGLHTGRVAQADAVYSAPLPPSIREVDMIPGIPAPRARRGEHRLIPRRLLVAAGAAGALALSAFVLPDVFKGEQTAASRPAAAQIGGNSYAQKQGDNMTMVTGRPSFQTDVSGSSGNSR